LVFCCGVILHLWDSHVESYRRQRRLIPQIEALRGTVYTEVAESSWRGELWPDEAFVKVVFVGLSYAPIDDPWLGHLHQLPHVRKLFLDRTRIGDAGLVHVSCLKELQMLGLTRTQGTDAGLAHLQGSRALESLWLDGSAISDAGLANLEKLKRLRLLALRGCPITDAGLGPLRHLKELQVLDLRDTPVTDAGVARLMPLTQLKTLLLDNTEVTDASLAHFKKLPALAEVSLVGTQIIPTSLHGVLALDMWVAPPRLVVKPGEKLTREFSTALHAPIVAKFTQRPLRDVLKHLSDQHALPSQLDPSVRANETVDIEFRGTPAALAVERILLELDLHGEIANNTIHIHRAYVRTMGEL
jgi:hypothetical protein